VADQEVKKIKELQDHKKEIETKLKDEKTLTITLRKKIEELEKR